MKYTNILKQSWDITWKNKYLWFFGLFAALLGNGGDLDIIVRGFDHDNKFFMFGWQQFSQTGIFNKNIFANIALLSVKEPLTLFLSLGTLLIFTFMVGFLIWMIISSQIAIVSNSVRIITGKKHNIKEGIKKGEENFWKVFIFSFILFALFIKEAMLQSVIYVVLFILFLILAVILSFIIKYAICFVIIKGYTVINSLRAGWCLFVKNWLISLEMAFLLFVLNFLVVFLLAPFFFVFLIFSKVVLYFGVWFLFVSSACLFLLIVALVGAILSTFQISSWTSLFVGLISRGGVSKLIRLFEKNKN